MINSYKKLFAGICFTASCLGVATAGDLPSIKNGGFEQGGSAPADWRAWAADEAKKPILSRDTAYAVKGASLKVVGTAKTSGSANARIHNAAGKTFEIKGIFSYEGKPKNCAIILQGSGGKGLWKEIKGARNTKRGKWEEFSSTVTIPKDVKRLSLLVYMVGKGTAWLDEVEISEVDKSNSVDVAKMPKSLPTINPTIKNGNFELGNITPESWSIWAERENQKPTIELDSDTSIKGSSLKVIAGKETNGNASTRIENAAASSFTISGNFRYEGDPKECAIVLQGSGKQQMWNVIIGKKDTKEGQWEKFSKKMSILGDISALRLMVYISGEGTAWLDEVKLVAEDAPKVTMISPVSPNVLSIVVEAQKAHVSKRIPYVPQVGDEWKDTNIKKRPYLKRNGKEIGSVVGPDKKEIQPFDYITGSALDEKSAQIAKSYIISSKDDTNYRKARYPGNVFLKSKPINIAKTGAWSFEWPKRHCIYLQLPSNLKEGATYKIALPGLKTKNRIHTYTHNPRSTRSEAVHISHIGFRPDELAKRAYISLWTGTGGDIKSYRSGTPFSVIDNNTDKVVYTDNITLYHPANKKDAGREKMNSVKANVLIADFTSLQTPGSYRVYVEGVGCSYPFDIKRQVWDKAYRTSARGFYLRRSGIPLGKPYTTWTRPRTYHPEDGMIIYQAKFKFGERLWDQDALFSTLVNSSTDEVVPNAWGGYFDAGDWDRRIQHLECSRHKLELLELNADYFAKIDHNIPESNDDLPDLLNEALWNVDFFKRIQKDHGGIPHGIEAAEHPNWGECSWEESLKVMMFAPDAYSSYVYAGVAARTALILKKIKPEMAQEYEDSALKAMVWAEKEYPKSLERIKKNNYKSNGPYPRSNDERQLAALELFRLTGDEKWHDLFKKITPLGKENALYAWRKYDTRDSAFIYARLDDSVADPHIKKKAKEGLIAEAESAIAYGRGTSFNWSYPDWGRHLGWGLLSTTNVESLIRSHVLTNDDKYLRATVLSCQTSAGANPLNISYTTGVGHDWPKNILCIDSRYSHQEAPEGVTIYGPMVMNKPADKLYWAVKILNDECVPKANQWPNAEGYFDTYMNPGQTEWTVMQNMSPNLYAWGYLAMREAK